MGPAPGSRALRWPAPLLACALLLAGLAGCRDGEEQRQPPSITRATATRDFADNAPALSSTVTVRFSRALTPPRDEIPLASGFEISIPDAFEMGPAQRVFVTEARISEQDPREVILRVERLVPDGSRLIVAGRLLGRGAADASARISSDVSGVQAVMASVALVPRNPAILGAGDFAEVTDADRDPDAMRDLLEEHLLTRQSSVAVTRMALSRYDEIPPEIVTSPKLRAALAALTGTFAEPAIDDLLTEENCTGQPVALIAFQDPPGDPALFARVTHDERGARIMSVSPRIEGEPLELLIPLMAHEAIHCDTEGSLVEEIVATSFDTLLYIQMLTMFPELALHGSPLSKDLNVDAIAMINSGRALPESLGVLRSPGVSQAVPSTNARAASFAELVAAAYAGQPPASPSEPLAILYAAILATAAGIQPQDAFNLEYLDAVIGTAIDPTALVAVIVALGLVPPE